MSEPAIQAQNLTRDFESVHAVDGLTIDVPAGIIFGLLGPNGAGKTTTIRLLLGLLEPTAGHARVLGYDTRTEADQIRQRTGALLEHAGLYERLSALDNLEYYGRIWRMPPGERQARIKALLAHLELWDRRNETVGTWSRGMKQKLAVARALLHRPSLVFLDEPTSGLDPVAAAALRDDLATLATQEGVTIALTTHNLDEAEKLCALVGVIREGKLIAVGHPDELRSRRSNERVIILGRGFDQHVLDVLRTRPEIVATDVRNGRLTIDLAAKANTAPLVNVLVNAGAEIEQVRKDKASLEDVFLTLMEEEQL